MKFETTNKIILAAILLPFIFMIAEGVLVVRTSFRQYVSLEKDYRFADVLARGGSIAANEILGETVATRQYLTHPGTDNAVSMQQSRARLDEERRKFQMSLPSAGMLDGNLQNELSDLALAYSRIISIRAAVDRGYYAGGDPGYVYWQAALKQLDVVDALSPLIQDPVLLEKSNELMGILLTYYGERLLTFIGTRHLSEHGYSLRSSDLYVQGKMMQAEGMDHMVFHSTSPLVTSITDYMKLPQQVRADAVTDAILTREARPSLEVRNDWAAAQADRIAFLKEKITEATADIHRTGETLAQRSHLHVMLVFVLCGGLLLLAGVVATLATKGLGMISRLTREREVLVGELRSAAQTDLLTGLYNRRGFEAAAAALFEQAKSGSRWISVVLFDLDHFKKINDIHGHDVGDIVLRHVAAVAKHNFRQFDLLVRHGGEEFLALLPDVTPDEAAAVAEAVREAIERAVIILPGGESLVVTASFGCAGRTQAGGGHHFEDLVKRADMALYAAKASGRNCVVAGSLVPQPMARAEAK